MRKVTKIYISFMFWDTDIITVCGGYSKKLSSNTWVALDFNGNEYGRFNNKTMRGTLEVPNKLLSQVHHR